MTMIHIIATVNQVDIISVWKNTKHTVVVIILLVLLLLN